MKTTESSINCVTLWGTQVRRHSEEEIYIQRYLPDYQNVEPGRNGTMFFRQIQSAAAGAGFYHDHLPHLPGTGTVSFNAKRHSAEVSWCGRLRGFRCCLETIISAAVCSAVSSTGHRRAFLSALGGEG